MKTIAMIPTYNEVLNMRNTIESVLNCGVPGIEVLIVDDMSPDGSYKIVEEISKTDNRVHLLLRKEKRGRGYAGIDGFKKSLEMGADFIVEMDADGSHNPKYIPKFLEMIDNYSAAQTDNYGAAQTDNYGAAQSNDYGAIIGSRFIKGGSDEERGFLRKTISAMSRIYLSFVIGTKVKDPTSGFRLFKRETLETFVDKLKARDPFIVTEVLFYLQKNKIKVAECPIEFLQRKAGQSKLRPFTLIKYLFKVLLLRINF